MPKQISFTSLLYGLIIITPFIDNVNGAFVLKYGGDGVSIGTFYRMLIILLMVYILLEYELKIKYAVWIFFTLYFPVNCLLRYDFYSLSLASSISYGIKWIFPVIMIAGLGEMQRLSNKRLCISILDIWSFVIPGFLIAEFLLGLGEKSYWDAGFRGLYFSINDLGFSLTVMMLYSLYRLIIVEVNLKYVLATAVNFIAIIILATKSCLLFSVIALIYFMILKVCSDFKKAVICIMLMSVLFVLLCYIMDEKIIEMTDRYTLFYEQSDMSNSALFNVMSFLTSARVLRIEDVWHELSFDSLIIGLLFGWKPPYNGGAIEMDWLDAFFQHGLVGILILGGYCYSLFFKVRDYKKPWMFMLIVAMICSFFSGHVLNGALSSTVLAVLVQCAFTSRITSEGKLDECINRLL